MANEHLGANKITALQGSINLELKNFLESSLAPIREISPELEVVANDLLKFSLNSGKRLRPIFALIAALAKEADLTLVQVKAAVALELIHVCALIHDDVIDQSESRRGERALHKAFEIRHQNANGSGDAKNYGVGAAILVGDLALVLADKALTDSGLDLNTADRAKKILDELRVELMAGQFLDIYEQTLSSASGERARKIAQYKSGKYTIERPLHFGAALVATGTELIELKQHFSAYGIPLGEAFQLRDDLLGVFGDPSETGKPAGDDLREGKKTLLVAFALAALSGDDLDYLKNLLGKQDATLAEIKRAQELIANCGAVAEVEALIAQLVERATLALAQMEIRAEAKELLSLMIEKTTVRKS